jgi:hypothetical protein
MSLETFDSANVAAALVSNRNKQFQALSGAPSNPPGFRQTGTDLLDTSTSNFTSPVTSSSSSSSSSVAQIVEDRSVRLKSVLRAGRSFADVAPPRKKRTQLIETRVKFKVSRIIKATVYCKDTATNPIIFLYHTHIYKFIFSYH